MTADPTPPLRPRLLRTALVVLGAVTALGTGAGTAAARSAAVHPWHPAWHRQTPHAGHRQQHREHWHHINRTSSHHGSGRGHHQAHHAAHPAHAKGHHKAHRPIARRGPARRSLPVPFRRGTEAAIRFALAHLGDGYSYGGNGPHWWDCSGLVQQAYRRAGIRLPRIAAAQYRAAVPIRRSQLRRGDLVFWSSNGHPSGIHHVAVYLGRGHYIEAPRPGRRVRVSSFALYHPTMYARV